MVPRINLETNRGGFRSKKKLKSSQALLIDVIIENCGGPAVLAEALRIHPQIPINWRVSGKVPLKMVKRVANMLAIPVWALNYTDLSGIFELTDTWKDIVKQCGFDPADTRRILEGAPPKTHD